MAEIEIINHNPEIIEDSNNTEIIEDKPIEIIDRRKLLKKVEEDAPPVEKNDKRKILRALWRTTILEDGTKHIIKNHATRFTIRSIMMRNVKKKN